MAQSDVIDHVLAICSPIVCESVGEISGNCTTLAGAISHEAISHATCH